MKNPKKILFPPFSVEMDFFVGRVADWWIQFESCSVLNVTLKPAGSRDWYAQLTRVSFNRRETRAIISSTRHNLIFKWGRNSLATAICLAFSFPSTALLLTSPRFTSSTIRPVKRARLEWTRVWLLETLPRLHYILIIQGKILTANNCCSNNGITVVKQRWILGKVACRRSIAY